MYKSILVAIDGSDHSEKAVVVAAVLAEKFGAKLTLLHVVDPGSMTRAIRNFAEVEHIVEPRAGIAQELPRVPGWMSDAQTLIRE